MSKHPKPQSPADAAYWEALGRFVETLATVEMLMFALLAFYSKVSEKAARALFSGTRTDASIKLVRRLIAVHDPGAVRRKELEIIFAHLTAINDARNDIIHYGSLPTSEGRMTTNLSRAHLPENVTWRPISAAILTAMTDDLGKIIQHLMLHQAYPEDQETKDRIAAFENPLYAWQYKPPKDHEMKGRRRPRPGQPR